MAILPPYQYCDVLSVDVSTIGYEHREIVCSEMVATGAATRRITQYCFRCRKIRKQVLQISKGTNVWSVNIDSGFSSVMHDVKLPPRCRCKLPHFGIYAAYIGNSVRTFWDILSGRCSRVKKSNIPLPLAMGHTSYPRTSVQN